MELPATKPKSMFRPKQWTEEVEDFYRFQLAGYKDENEYVQAKRPVNLERWPENGFIKKLQRRDGCFYYYNRKRECLDKDVYRTKVYVY